MKEWEDLSDYYDRKQGEEGDLWHGQLIDPVLLKVIGKTMGLSVLDLGCGNGYLSRRLAKAGAIVTAVDSSKGMVKNAKARDPKNLLKIKYLVSDATKMDVPDASQDLVFANMSLMDIEDAEGAVKEVARLLKKGGRFVASIPHPCFLVESNSGWVMEKVAFEPPKVYRKVRAYRENFSDLVPWSVTETTKKFTREFHRPLNWYARIFFSAGLAITALEEPMPSKEFLEREAKKDGDLDSKGFLEVPLHLVIEARKL